MLLPTTLSNRHVISVVIWLFAVAQDLFCLNSVLLLQVRWHGASAARLTPLALMSPARRAQTAQRRS